MAHPERTSQELLAMFREVPMAHTIVSCFEGIADPKSLQVEWYYGDPHLLADCNNPELKISMTLKGSIDHETKRSTHLSLEFYSQELAYRLQQPDSIFVTNFATFTAGVKQTGVWAYGGGRQLSYGISVSFNGNIYLPTRRGRWILELAHKFALLSSEHNLSLDDQPRFWEHKP